VQVLLSVHAMQPVRDKSQAKHVFTDDR